MRSLLKFLHTLGAIGPAGAMASMPVLLACLVAICVALPGPVFAASDAIDALRWQNRIVLVFAAAGAEQEIAGLDERLAKQECALRDRDVVVARIGPGPGASLGGRPLEGIDAVTLRTRYRVSPDEAAVLLVGKDGGVKLRESAAVDLGAMFDLIDGMPMRQREMRERADTC